MKLFKFLKKSKRIMVIMATGLITLSALVATTVSTMAWFSHLNPSLTGVVESGSPDLSVKSVVGYKSNSTENAILDTDGDEKLDTDNQNQGGYDAEFDVPSATQGYGYYLVKRDSTTGKFKYTADSKTVKFNQYDGDAGGSHEALTRMVSSSAITFVAGDVFQIRHYDNQDHKTVNETYEFTAASFEDGNRAGAYLTQGTYTNIGITNAGTYKVWFDLDRKTLGFESTASFSESITVTEESVNTIQANVGEAQTKGGRMPNNGPKRQFGGSKYLYLKWTSNVWKGWNADASDVSLHIWNDSKKTTWPGLSKDTTVTFNDEEFLRFDISEYSDATKCIFNVHPSGWGLYSQHQTGNLDVPSGANNLFVITSSNGDSNQTGSWHHLYTENDSNWYLAGTINSWNTSSANYKFSYSTAVNNNFEYTADKTIAFPANAEFKLVLDSDSNYYKVPSIMTNTDDFGTKDDGKGNTNVYAKRAIKADLSFQLQKGNANWIGLYWTEVFSTVTASANDDDMGTVSVGTSSVAYLGSSTLSATPKTGYHFVKWTKGGVQVSTSNPYTATSISDDSDYVAVFAPNTSNIVLDSVGGDPDSQNFAHTYGTSETIANEVSEPTKTGYDFDGWYTASSGGTEVTTIASSLNSPNADTTYYAHWTAHTYSVVFHKNNESAKGSMSNQGFVYGTAQNLTANDFTYEGYTFIGWATSPSGSVAYTNGQSVNNLTATDNGEFDLYAVWQECYSITFDNNGGTGSTVVLYEAKTDPVAVEMPTSGFTLSDYTFWGWNTEQDGTGTSYAKGTNNKTFGTDKTLYAVYKKNISLDKQGGGDSAELEVIYKKTPSSITPPERSNYTFGGYYTAAGGGGNQLIAANGSFSAAWTQAGTVETLYAKWTRTVSLNGNSDYGGDSTATLVWNAVAPSSMSSMPTRTGYDFDGYYSKNGTNDDWGNQIFDRSGAPTSYVWNVDDGTLYAKWSEKEYTVNQALHTNAGTITVNSKGYFDQALSIYWTSTTKTGYHYTLTSVKVYSGTTTSGTELASWTSGTGNTFTMTDTYYSDICIQVIYEEIANTYTVRFNKNNDGATETMESQDFTYGTPQNLTANGFSLTGYTFLGWATSPGGSVVYGNEQEVSNLTSANGATVDLYARWGRVYYFYDPDNTFGGTAYAYTWYNDGSNHSKKAWPGDAMTAVSTDAYGNSAPNANRLYKIELDAQYTYIIFNNNNNKKQTVNISVSASESNKIYVLGSVSSTDQDGTKKYNGTWYSSFLSSSTYTVYFYSGYNGAYWSGIKAYAWNETHKSDNYYYPSFRHENTAYPGVSIASAETASSRFPSGHIYKIVVSQSFEYIIFNTGNSGNQTANIPLTGSNNKIFVMSGTSEGKYTGSWQDNLSFTLTFNVNGGTSIASTNVNFSTALGTLPTATGKSGYTFGGWYTDNEVYSSEATSSTTMPEGGLAIYAKWTRTITLDANTNGGKVDSKNTVTLTHTYGINLDISKTAVKTYYDFSGWFTDSSSGSQVTTITNLTSATTLYAQYTIHNYSITYTLNDGTVSPENKTSYTYEDANFTLTNPTRTGYTFAGWTGTGLVSATITVTIAQHSSDDRSYTATWTANTYTITLDGQSPSSAGTAYIYLKYDDGYYLDSTCETKMTYNSNPIASLPSKTGHGLGGFYTQASGVGTQILSASGYIIDNLATNLFSANSNIYAYWQADEYTVTFDPGDGTVSPTNISVYYGSTYSGMPTPTYTGHHFDGWFSASDGGTEVTSSTEVGLEADGRTLYAHWTIYSCYISFSFNEANKYTGYYRDGPADETVTATYGSAMPSIVSNLPWRNNYTFEGYYDASSGGTKYYNADGSSALNWNKTTFSATTLYAHWTLNTNTFYLIGKGFGLSAEGPFSDSWVIYEKMIAEDEVTVGENGASWTNISFKKLYTDGASGDLADLYGFKLIYLKLENSVLTPQYQHPKIEGGASYFSGGHSTGKGDGGPNIYYSESVAQNTVTTFSVYLKFITDGVDNGKHEVYFAKNVTYKYYYVVDGIVGFEPVLISEEYKVRGTYGSLSTPSALGRSSGDDGFTYTSSDWWFSSSACTGALATTYDTRSLANDDNEISIYLRLHSVGYATDDVIYVAFDAPSTWEQDSAILKIVFTDAAGDDISPIELTKLDNDGYYSGASFYKVVVPSGGPYHSVDILRMDPSDPDGTPWNSRQTIYRGSSDYNCLIISSISSASGDTSWGNTVIIRAVITLGDGAAKASNPIVAYQHTASNSSTYTMPGHDGDGYAYMPYVEGNTFYGVPCANGNFYLASSLDGTTFTATASNQPLSSHLDSEKSVTLYTSYALSNNSYTTFYIDTTDAHDNDGSNQWGKLVVRTNKDDLIVLDTSRTSGNYVISEKLYKVALEHNKSYWLSNGTTLGKNQTAATSLGNDKSGYLLYVKKGLDNSGLRAFVWTSSSFPTILDGSATITINGGDPKIMTPGSDTTGNKFVYEKGIFVNAGDVISISGTYKSAAFTTPFYPGNLPWYINRGTDADRTNYVIEGSGSFISGKAWKTETGVIMNEDENEVHTAIAYGVRLSKDDQFAIYNTSSKGWLHWEDRKDSTIDGFAQGDGPTDHNFLVTTDGIYNIAITSAGKVFIEKYSDGDDNIFVNEKVNLNVYIFEENDLLYLSIAEVPVLGNGYYIMETEDNSGTQGFINGLKMTTTDYGAVYVNYYAESDTTIYVRSYINAYDQLIGVTADSCATGSGATADPATNTVSLGAGGHYKIQVSRGTVYVSTHHKTNPSFIPSALDLNATNDAASIREQKTSLVMAVGFTLLNNGPMTLSIKVDNTYGNLLGFAVWMEDDGESLGTVFDTVRTKLYNKMTSNSQSTYLTASSDSEITVTNYNSTATLDVNDDKDKVRYVYIVVDWNRAPSGTEFHDYDNRNNFTICVNQPRLEEGN